VPRVTCANIALLLKNFVPATALWITDSIWFAAASEITTMATGDARRRQLVARKIFAPSASGPIRVRDLAN